MNIAGIIGEEKILQIDHLLSSLSLFKHHLQGFITTCILYILKQMPPLNKHPGHHAHHVKSMLHV